MTAVQGTERAETFVVSKDGLAKIMARRGKEFIVGELISNAWDERSTEVHVELTRHPEWGTFWILQVRDDNPDGFADLSHAYTLFAESSKKGDSEKRGRFNLGEKLVIAVCETATISTTTGVVRFDDNGRHMGPPVIDSGSVFTGVIRMTDEEVEATRTLVFSMLPPEHIATFYNGERVPSRASVATFEKSLRTERADADGNLRPTTRKTAVTIYEPQDGETAMLYEMGIPVVETGDRWHVDVAQKIPVNTDRDNVPPAYLRDIRSAVLNATAERIKGTEAASERWVTDALQDKRTTPEAVRTIITERFGDKAVIADPNDREGERMAVSQGYTVVTGGALPKAAWANVKAAEALKPAGEVTPSPNPSKGEDDVPIMDPAHWPESVASIAAYAQQMATAVLGHRGQVFDLRVRIANAPKWRFAATWGKRGTFQAELTLNLGTLGYRWFDAGPSDTVHELLIHEMAHQYASNHLSSDFYDACCLVGARLAAAYARGALVAENDTLGSGVPTRGEVG